MALQRWEVAGARRGFGPDSAPAFTRKWDLPSDGDSQLTIEFELLNWRVVRIDGKEVARFKRPTLAEPWREATVPGSKPEIKVAQIAFPHDRYKTLVFVNGSDVELGRPEDDWRRSAPAPMDLFEIVFIASRLWGPWGALLAALGTAAPVVAIAASSRNITLLWIPFVVVAAAIAGGWVLVTSAFAHVLRRRRTWPSTLRIFMVVFVMLAVPLVVLLSLKQLTSAG